MSTAELVAKYLRDRGWKDTTVGTGRQAHKVVVRGVHGSKAASRVYGALRATYTGRYGATHTQGYLVLELGRDAGVGAEGLYQKIET